MISSTRSSESASRSSWKEASSVISLSSTPSCSVKTSLTRSKTSSRDAAMTPRCVWGAEARRSYTDAFGQPLGQPIDDPMLDTARCELDRVADRAPAGVAVRDHREPLQPEEVRAAVGVRVEARAEPAGGRAD